MDPQDPNSPTDAVLAESAQRLQEELVLLASRLKPFPAFLGMTPIQAIELEPVLLPNPDRGCVVVTPDGQIAELDVASIPGVVGISDVEQVEQFQPLDLPLAEYIVYARAAVAALTEELRRRRE